MLEQQPHRRDVGRVGGAPERCGTLEVHVQVVAIVCRVPETAVQPHVRIGVPVEERLHELQIRRPLLEIVGGLRRARAGRPFLIEDAVERCGSGITRQVRIGPALEQKLGEIVVAIDAGEQQRTRLIGRRQLVDVGAAVEQRAHRFRVALAHSEKERGETALKTNLLGVAVQAKRQAHNTVETVVVGGARPRADRHSLTKPKHR